MKELEKILDEITSVCNEKLDDFYKKHIITNLWKYYYSKKEQIVSSQDDEMYIIEAEPLIEEIDNQKLIDALKNLKINNSVTLTEADIILKWIVLNARKNISKLGINIKKNNLDGFCELGQLITIYPLEQLGLVVTKNTAQEDFDYPYNHAFGTVEFNINENKKTYTKLFLIDITYRQFFTKEKCNKGKFYIDERPDVGYYVNDLDFAKELIKNGYVELNSKTARLYGEPFNKYSIYEEKNDEIDYLRNIIDSSDDYVLSKDNLDGLDINFPKM